MSKQHREHLLLTFMASFFLLGALCFTPVLKASSQTAWADDQDIAVDDGIDGEGEVPDGTPVAQDITYSHSQTAEQNGVVFTVYWDEPSLAQETHFHVTVYGASENARARMDVPYYTDTDGSGEDVADPARTQYWPYQTMVDGEYDFSFTMKASGTYRFRFYFMDTDNDVTWLRTELKIQLSDSSYPSVSQIAKNAVAQCKAAGKKADYEQALWLHDWLLDQLEYDNSFKWSSAEAALTRGAGTCQAYTNAYAKLLDAAGIENSETRDDADGHTWNAVKLGGNWYQVDCTWDDNKNSSSYGFDSRHLYFCLTDELMAIAHKGHQDIYTGSSYATRSTSYTDNYYMQHGEAATWANAYTQRIQAKLNAESSEFFITDDLNIADSIDGIVNGIVAHELQTRSWSTSTKNCTLTVTPSAAGFTIQATYESKPPSIDASMFTLSTYSATYTGSAIKPSVKSSTVSAGCYTVSYRNNVNAGTGVVAITAKDGWTGTCEIRFTISPAQISKVTISRVSDAAYTSYAITPNPSLTYAGRTLSNGADYTTSYRDNIKVGTATITVTGKGNFTGTRSTAFKIYRSSPAQFPNGMSRISGATRYETMSSLANAGNWSKGGCVILASGSNYPDALAAAALAGVKDAPILLTAPNSLSDATCSRLASLRPSRVYIIGGQAAVSVGVEQQVRQVTGCAITRLSGATRYETSARVAAEIRGFSSTVIIATGWNYADALSISPYAFTAGSPVLLCDPASGLSSAVLAEILAGGYKQAIILGGTAAVPASVESQLRAAGISSTRRLSGATRYETSAAIARYVLGSGMGFAMDGLLLTTGQNFPDALAAGPLAGRRLAPLLLVDSSGNSASSFLSAYRGQVKRACIVGGSAAISTETAQKVAGALGINVL